MYPVLFTLGNFSIYSYGFMIAVGVMAGVSYMAVMGKKEVGLSFDQANTLFLYIFVAAFIGGKVFLFFEEPSHYMSTPKDLVSGRGFVFYGSFIFAVPTMLWYFKKNKLNTYRMPRRHGHHNMSGAYVWKNWMFYDGLLLWSTYEKYLRSDLHRPNLLGRA